MKRICFLSGDITRSGGTEKVACQIMNGLCDTYQVIVISLFEKNDRCFYSLDERIKRVKLFEHNPGGIKNYVSIVRKLKKILKEKQIDILIDIDSILDMFSVMAVRGLHTKLISWEHFNFYESMGNRFRVPIRKYITKKADVIVTLTKEDQLTFIKVHRGQSRVEQIYNPIEFEHTSLKYNSDSKTIISVGRLAKQKGFDYLIDVANIVLKQHPDWNWIILGEGDERPLLEAGIAEKRLDNLRLMGKVSNVSEYLKEASLFVLTSRYEGFPLVLIEAKANLLPVVSFKCKTGPAELVRDSVNGYLVDCFNIEEMAVKICKLIESYDLRESFSQKALLDTEKMDYSLIIEQWKKILETVG